jgi:hypothetical protein
VIDVLDAAILVDAMLDPTDAIEALLEDVVGPGHDIGGIPESQ